jgi:predicted dehydrogenase
VKTLKFVIVGTGNISKTYIDALSKIDSAELVGFVSRSGKTPDGIGCDLPVAAELNALTCDYDAVILAVPNGLHGYWAVKAAALGKHVLTEKPLDITVEAMDQMIQACDAAGVKLAVSYQHRGRPDNMIIKELLEQGTLGKVFAADLQVKCYRGQEYYDSAAYRGGYEIDGGGPFIQQACHQIDLYGWFFGRPEKTVSMLGTFMHDIEGEDHGVAILKHSNGMIGTIEASTCTYPGFEASFAIHTEKGSLRMINNIVVDWQFPEIKNPSVSQGMIFHSGAGSAAVKDTSGHETIILDFIDAVVTDREPMVSGKAARLATEIVLDIYNNNVY